MIYVLITVIFALILIVCFIKDGEPENALLSGLAGLVIVGLIFMGLDMYAREYKSDYLESKIYDNPTQIQTLEALPFNSDTSTDVYVIKGKDTWNNSIYNYCIKTEQGLDEQTIGASVDSCVYIDDIDANEKPHLKIETKSKERILVKKPSFWLNFWGWLEYKDVSIGDIVEEAEICEANYTFCVPKGTSIEEPHID